MPAYKFNSYENCASLSATWKKLLDKTPFDPERWDEYRFTLAFDDGTDLPYFHCPQQDMYPRLALPWNYLIEVEDDDSQT